jgi:phosphoribosylamine--glycine ligase
MLQTHGVECLVLESHKIVEFCLDHRIDFVVVGPDQALADGLVDQLSAAGVLAFGPTKAAAELEWSKAFAKDVMRAADVPTAQYNVFTDFNTAEKFIVDSTWPGWAIKADGLALGKGVIVTRDRKEAIDALKDFLVNKTLGSAGRCVVVEELLSGPEVSAFYLCDGSTAVPLGFACDYKQLLDGGQGPNTGGMGAYSPVDWLSADVKAQIFSTVVEPVLADMQKRGRPFKGVLFVGLMITASGPRVLEFNTRFGDPETQALMPTLVDDFLPWLLACARGELAEFLQHHDQPQTKGSAVHVVLAAHGYPAAVRKGDGIDFKLSDDVEVFFAGVAQQEDSLVTNGGRVMGLTAVASTRKAAREQVYAAVDKIYFSGKQFRKDVGA